MSTVFTDGAGQTMQMIKLDLAFQAFYSLADPEKQLMSYIFNNVRAQIPNHNLDEVCRGLWSGFVLGKGTHFEFNFSFPHWFVQCQPIFVVLLEDLQGMAWHEVGDLRNLVSVIWWDW